MKLPAPVDVAAALDAAYAGVTAVVSGRPDSELLLPSGCLGWTVADLLLHVTGDARRALVALHTPADGPADVDFVSYWRAFPAGDADEIESNVQRVRQGAAAFARPGELVDVWSETSAAAGHAGRSAEFAGFVRTQKKVLAVPDFLATLITEAVVHHLDLSVSLPDAPPPADAAVTIAVSTLEGLAGPAGLPEHWSPLESLRKGTGREELDTPDERFPLLG